jgi:SAM-dependent methyltransferase
MATEQLKSLTDYHATRFSYDKRRDVLWRTLCRAYFQRLIAHDACVLELGAGYGHFINHIRCGRRIAIDSWEGLSRFASPGVTVHIGNITDLGEIPDGSVDFVFASNVFEHLTQQDFASALAQIRIKLKTTGTLNILQPNYRFAYREYFDDFTHIAIYSHVSMTDFLSANGFDVIECHPRFLPLTVKTRLPVWPLLVRLYLLIPVKPLGKQMFLRAVVRDPSHGS